MYYGYYNEDEQSIIDCYTYNYTYDENYRYEEMIYHLLGGKRATTVYDARRDEVQTEFYTSEGEFISFEAFFEYQVEGNTVRRKSWVDDYEGTGWTLERYDDEGNLIYYGHTNNSGEIESETICSYIYDDNNRVVQENSDDYRVNGYPSQTIRNYVYEGDLLIQETEKNVLNIGAGAMEITSSETTDYYYDEFDNLLYEKSYHVSDSIAGGHRVGGYFMVYEYEISNDDIPMNVDIDALISDLR